MGGCGMRAGAAPRWRCAGGGRVSVSPVAAEDMVHALLHLGRRGDDGVDIRPRCGHLLEGVGLLVVLHQQLAAELVDD
eukprot:1134735-Prymnesium_polylepis.1